MSGHLFLDRIDEMVKLKVRLTNVSAFRIGAGEPGVSPTEPDNMVIKYDGKPFIPGSSIKGIFRSTVESIYRERPSENGRRFVCEGTNGGDFCVDPKNRKDSMKESEWEREIESNACYTCLLFGNTSIASRIFFSDAHPVNNTEVSVRDGVMIRRDTETAMEGRKYDYEVTNPGASFEFEIEIVNPLEHHIEMIKNVLKLMNMGYIKIGGNKSRGLGRFKAEIESAERLTIENGVVKVSKMEGWEDV